jgi:homoserine O-acetyltransferase
MSNTVNQLPEVETQHKQFKSLLLKSGVVLEDYTLTYTTHGKLNPKKDNAILLFHAFSGGSHCYGTLKRNEEIGNKPKKDEDIEKIDPKQYLEKFNQFREPKNGWWNALIGPRKAFDPEKYFIICANYLGGCYGSTGPCSINPKTGLRYASKFPVITMKDVVSSQKKLVESLGIEKLFAIAGGSVGGQCVLEWALSYPDSAELHVPIATCATRENIFVANNDLQKYSIMQDPNFNGGEFYNNPWPAGWPTTGLKVARMAAHITYINLDAKEVRTEIIPNDITLDPYEIRNPLESYFHSHGNNFLLRFDPNTYIKIVDAWSELDLLKEHNAKDLKELFSRCKNNFLVVGLHKDYCMFEENSEIIWKALEKTAKSVQYKPIYTFKGHDAFLLEEEKMNDAIKPVLDRTYENMAK